MEQTEHGMYPQFAPYICGQSNELVADTLGTLSGLDHGTALLMPRSNSDTWCYTLSTYWRGIMFAVGRLLSPDTNKAHRRFASYTR